MTRSSKFIADCFILMASLVLSDPFITDGQRRMIKRLLKQREPNTAKLAPPRKRKAA